MPKLILPTSIDFDLVVILSHLKGDEVKIDFTKDENELLTRTLVGPFRPVAVDYESATYRIALADLEDKEAKRFASSLRFLLIEAIERLVNKQAKVVADINEIAHTAAYLIDWAQDDNEIPTGAKGKVLLHCSAELEGKRYIVKIDATSPAYSF